MIIKKYQLNIKNHINSFFISTKKYFYSDVKWFYITILIISSYLLLFQSHFVFSGDQWAEAFPEYVNDAINGSWREIFNSGWAGYLTIIPSFLSKAYVELGLPLGYIDLFFRGITVTFTVLCVSFLGHPINRGIIKSDKIRVFAALMIILAIRHVSALAFINIWYLGFIVIILFSLSKEKISIPIQLIYTTFAVLTALSKSSLVLLPFVLYYAFRTKRYISSLAIISAVLLQTYLTVFSVNGYGSSGIKIQIIDIFKESFIGLGDYLFKILHLAPLSIYAVIASGVFMVAIFVFLLFKRGFWETSILGLGLFISIYLYIFAPDSGLTNLWINYPTLYNDIYKIQREFIIIFLIIIVFSMFVSTVLKNTKFSNNKKNVFISLLAIAITISINPLAKIDTISPGLQSNISNYRYSLNNKESICMPVPPTQMWDYQAAWFFQYKGGCYTKQSPKQIDKDSFNNIIDDNGLNITIDSKPNDDIKTLTLLLKGNFNISKNQFILTDSKSGRSFTAISPKNSEEYHFINFNLTGLGPNNSGYSFIIKSLQNPGLYASGNFKDSSLPVTYSYFMGYPNIQ